MNSIDLSKLTGGITESRFSPKPSPVNCHLSTPSPINANTRHYDRQPASHDLYPPSITPIAPLTTLFCLGYITPQLLRVPPSTSAVVHIFTAQSQTP